jgi:hypothetical protein
MLARQRNWFRIDGGLRVQPAPLELNGRSWPF